MLNFWGIAALPLGQQIPFSTPAFSITVSAGTYSYTGSAVTINIGTPLSAGTYTFSGSALTFGIGAPVSGGSYTFTGTPMTFGIGMPIVPGIYSVNGASMTFSTSGGPTVSAEYSMPFFASMGQLKSW